MKMGAEKSDAHFTGRTFNENVQINRRHRDIFLLAEQI